MFIYFKLFFDYLYLKLNGVETSFGFVTLRGLPMISKYKNSKIIIEKGVTLISSSRFNIAGINHPVILATTSENAEIRIGEGSGLSGSTLVACRRILIGKNVGLGVNSSIYDTDFHPIDPNKRLNQKSMLEAKSKEVIIGDSVWLAANVVVLKGVHVGKDSVIGANSVVTSNIDSGQIYAGNPARLVKRVVYE